MFETPRALVDMDGTLCNYHDAMQRDLKKLAAPDEKKPKAFKVNERRPNYIKAREEAIRGRPGWWLELEPLKKGFEILEMLQEAGFDIQILTKGPRESSIAWIEKKQWCEKYIPDVNISVVLDKTNTQGDVLFDDWFPYYEGWKFHNPGGLVIIPDQKWNKKTKDDCFTIRYTGRNMKKVRAKAEQMYNLAWQTRKVRANEFKKRGF